MVFIETQEVRDVERESAHSAFPRERVGGKWLDSWRVRRCRC